MIWNNLNKYSRILKLKIKTATTIDKIQITQTNLIYLIKTIVMQFNIMKQQIYG